MIKIEDLAKNGKLVESKVIKLAEQFIQITKGLQYKNIKQSPTMKLHKTVYKGIEGTDAFYIQIVLASEPISFTKISGLMNAGENIGMFSDLDILNGWICPEHEDLATEELEVDPKSYSTEVTDIEILKYHLKRDFRKAYDDLKLVDEETSTLIESCVHPVNDTLSVSKLARDFTIILTAEWVL